MTRSTSYSETRDYRGSGHGEDELQIVPVADLTPGLQLQTPIYDDDKILLLAGGKTITLSLINGLKRRGIESVQVHRSEIHRIYHVPETPQQAPPPKTRLNSRLAPRLPKPAPEVLAPRVSGLPPLKPHERPFVEQIRAPGMKCYSSTNVLQMLGQYQQALGDLQHVYQSWIGGNLTDLERPRQIAVETLEHLTADRDLLIRVGLQAGSGDFPVRQSLQTAWLAIAIGTTLNLPEASLIDLGTGCLLHDIGLLRLRPQVQEQIQATGTASHLEIAKHPRLAYDLLSRNDRTPATIKMIVLQMHERNDGSGYPCQRKGRQIHPLARIAAVAHAYVQLIAPYAAEPGIGLYDAQRFILEETHLGRFDADVTRGVLQTTALIPIGSTVQLMDGREARVLRANPDDYSRPIVQLSAPDETGSDLLDLSLRRDLTVSQVISWQPTAAESATV